MRGLPPVARAQPPPRCHYIVSPLTQLGEANPRADVQPGCDVIDEGRGKRHQTYPELARAQPCRLVVVDVGTGGRFGALGGRISARLCGLCYRAPRRRRARRRPRAQVARTSCRGALGPRLLKNVR